MPYQFADGQNNAGSLANVTIQPASPGAMYAEVRVAMDRTRYPDGDAYAEWHYSSLEDDQFTTLLAEFGLTSEQTNECTVRTTNDLRSFANYNGIIVRPVNGQTAKYKMGLWEDVIFRIDSLEAL